MKRAKGNEFVTSSAEEYWSYARQCLEIAPSFQDKEARATLLGLAQAWSRLAHLALANRHIAELTVQIARQRVIVKHALDSGQRSEMAVSLLDALEGSLRLFEKHRIFLLSCSVNRPSNGSSKRPDPVLGRDGPGLVRLGSARPTYKLLCIHKSSKQTGNLPGGM
jgi:hypothetical protein